MLSVWLWKKAGCSVNQHMFKNRRTDLLVLLNIGLIVLSLLLLMYTWYRSVLVDDNNSITGLHSVLLLVTMGCGLVMLINAVGFIYPATKLDRAENSKMNLKTETLRKQATTDVLTGMFNRRYFEDALSDYLREFNAVGATLGLLVLDLDHFKSVNDNYGHDVGDQVLREVALRMRAISRDHDVVARLGGEEFAVITPYATKEQLLGVAERYREMVEALNVENGNVVIRPTVSIGVATNEGGVVNPEDLFKAADEKLYEAKNSGRNRVAA